MPAEPAFTVVPLDESRRPLAHTLIAREWGALTIVTRGQAWDVRDLPGMVAVRRAQLQHSSGEDSDLMGLVLYRLDGDQCEVMVLNSWVEGIGVGSALLEAVEAAARAAGCTRIWLITTNDNLHALGFYQRRGYRLAALYPNALEESRRLKPEIPLMGMNGIPLGDEIELGKGLGGF